MKVSSISAALSRPVFVPPRERSFGSFPEQRLVIELNESTTLQLSLKLGSYFKVYDIFILFAWSNVYVVLV